MNKQLTFSLISDELAQAKTSKKEFLEKIEQIIPFDEWIEIIRPCYYKGERGNKPYDLELMLRIFIAAPSSTKNKYKKRDKDAHSVKKGN